MAVRFRAVSWFFIALPATRAVRTAWPLKRSAADCHNLSEGWRCSSGSKGYWFSTSDGGGCVDAIVRRLQSIIEKIASVRFRAMPVWVGVGRLTGSQFGYMGARKKRRSGDTTVAKVIEFYVPKTFRMPVSQLPRAAGGTVIAFRPRPANTLDSSGSSRTCEFEPRSRSAVVDRK